MTDTLPPLTSAELADLKADTRDPYRLFPPSTVLRLIAVIERRDEQIEKLRSFALDVTRDPLNAKYELAREALAATEPHDE